MPAHWGQHQPPQQEVGCLLALIPQSWLGSPRATHQAQPVIFSWSIQQKHPLEWWAVGTVPLHFVQERPELPLPCPSRTWLILPSPSRGEAPTAGLVPTQGSKGLWFLSGGQRTLTSRARTEQMWPRHDVTPRSHHELS
jgi:hypothetical protein